MRRKRVGGGGLPVPCGSELHRLEAGDSLLDGRVSGEERGEAARGQRVHDEEVRGGRRGRERVLLRGDFELLERMRERSEERRVGKECRGRWGAGRGGEGSRS